MRLIRKEKNDSKYYTAGGHTQTWEYAYSNEGNDWFVGTKPNDKNEIASKWTKQIARVHIPQSQKIKSNTDLRRISYLNQAGSKFGIGYSGALMFRAEAAVSLDHKYFMIITGDNSENSYFSIYRLKDINDALDNNGTNAVDIREQTCIDAFKITNLSGANGLVGSLQGFDFSFNEQNKTGYIYISSQYSPDKGTIAGSRKIVKIPWKSTDPSEWEEVNLDNNTSFDYKNYKTEFEGIQLIGDDELYLTVAYHDYKPNEKVKWPTVVNMIYKISWTSNI